MPSFNNGIDSTTYRTNSEHRLFKAVALVSALTALILLQQQTPPLTCESSHLKTGVPSGNTTRVPDDQNALHQLQEVLGCQGLSWQHCAELVVGAKQTSEQEAEHVSNTSSSLLSEEWVKLLDCHPDEPGNCQKALVVLLERRKHMSKALEDQRQKALERSNQTRLEYVNESMFFSHHPALVPMDRRYKSSPSWTDTIADLNIVGIPKAGTSQLYRILLSHSRVRALETKDKEFCMSRGPHMAKIAAYSRLPPNPSARPTPEQLVVQQHLHTFYQALHQRLHNRNMPVNTMTVNGCLWPFDVELSYHYIRPTNKKYLFLFRDPADWLWAVFNFWQQEMLDTTYKPGAWVKTGISYRTPELFHEIIASGEETRAGQRFVNLARDATMTAIKLRHMVGSNALYLRNEDMLPERVAEPGGFLDRLSNFTGLERSAFDISTYSVMTNCNDAKGDRSKCGTTRSSAYAIAGGREILPETRALIYLRFQQECKLWYREFGIYYPECVHATDS
jgi:hypothetical protein